MTMEEKEPVVEDQRAPDQDAALEAAFVAGTLPEEDRREVVADEPSEAPMVNDVAVLAEPVVDPTAPVASDYPAVLVDEPLALRIHLLLDQIGQTFNAWEHVAMRQLRAMFVRTMPPNPDTDA